MQPYNYKLILLSGIGLLILFIINLMPELPNLFGDIVLRSVVVMIVFVPLVYIFNISEDFNRLLKKGLNVLRINLK